MWYMKPGVTIAFFVVVSFFYNPLAAPVVYGADETAPGCIQKTPDAVLPQDQTEDPGEFISDQLEKIGLDTKQVNPIGEDEYLVDIEKFESGSGALSTKGKFRPCTLKVKVKKGKVILERCSLEDAGFRSDSSRFPSSLGIEEEGIWGREK